VTSPAPGDRRTPAAEIGSYFHLDDAAIEIIDPDRVRRDGVADDSDREVAAAISRQEVDASPGRIEASEAALRPVRVAGSGPCRDEPDDAVLDVSGR